MHNSSRCRINSMHKPDSASGHNNKALLGLRFTWAHSATPESYNPLTRMHNNTCANGKLTREKFKPARARRSSPRKHNLCFVLSDYRLFFFISAYSSAPPRRLCKCTRGALQFRSRFPKDDDDHAKFPKARNIFSFFSPLILNLLALPRALRRDAFVRIRI